MRSLRDIAWSNRRVARRGGGETRLSSNDIYFPNVTYCNLFIFQCTRTRGFLDWCGAPGLKEEYVAQEITGKMIDGVPQEEYTEYDLALSSLLTRV